MPCAPSFDVHDTIDAIEVVPPVESDEEMWSRIENEAAELAAKRSQHVPSDRSERFEHSTVRAPDGDGGAGHDAAPADVRVVRVRPSTRILGMIGDHWWHNCQNIASFLEWLNDKEGGLEVNVLIQIVDKPWNWDREYDEMLASRRGPGYAKRPPASADEAASDDYEERQGV